MNPDCERRPWSTSGEDGPLASDRWLPPSLGATQVGVAVSVNAAIVMFAGTLAAFLASRPLWLRAQRYLMGGVLGSLALRLATEPVRPATAG